MWYYTYLKHSLDEQGKITKKRVPKIHTRVSMMEAVKGVQSVCVSLMSPSVFSE